jgi:hypothetical protein
MATPTVKPYPTPWPAATSTKKATKWFDKENDVIREDVRQAFLLLEGGDRKQDVRVATTAALETNTQAGTGVGATLTKSSNGALPSIDGVALAVGDRLLVKDEAAPANNGIYTVTDLGSASTPWVLTRATDADADAEVNPGLKTKPIEGTANAGIVFILIGAADITVDTDAQTFVAEQGLTEIASKVTAPAGNIGLLHVVDVEVAANTNGNTDTNLPEGTWRFVDAIVRMNGVGTGSDTVQVSKSGAAITEALDVSAAGDKARLPFATIDDANIDLDGGTDVLRVTTADATHPALTVSVMLKKIQ